MPTKDQWRYQIHVHPMSVNLSTLNEAEYLVQKGVWGTRRQAANEGVTAAATLATMMKKSSFVHYQRNELSEMMNALCNYHEDSLAFIVNDTQQLVHISLEIN